jgi:hypothetical protein
LEGGYTLDNIRFPAPLGLGSTPSPDEEVLDGLSKSLFGGALPLERRNRIGRALEWFVRAHSESPSLSDASAIVMMATAFECLLAPGKQDTSLFIADFFQDIHLDGDALETREVSRKNKPRTETKAMQAWFAYDLYKLRNDIVHGKEIAYDRFALTVPKRVWHKRIVATALFWEAMLNVLSEDGLIDGGTKDFVNACGFNDEDGAIEAKWRARSFSIDDLHHALGWR